mmetsp:Transcript_12774/g.30193  ORF Transcript_12774/g.30193 Transcript_12774/m.30193 type:complete len:162 (-) Transcript_12774:31-516(-)
MKLIDQTDPCIVLATLFLLLCSAEEVELVSNLVWYEDVSVIRNTRVATFISEKAHIIRMGCQLKTLDDSPSFQDTPPSSAAHTDTSMIATGDSISDMIDEDFCSFWREDDSAIVDAAAAVPYPTRSSSSADLRPPIAPVAAVAIVCPRRLPQIFAYDHGQL